MFINIENSIESARTLAEAKWKSAQARVNSIERRKWITYRAASPVHTGSRMRFSFRFEARERERDSLKGPSPTLSPTILFSLSLSLLEGGLASEASLFDLSLFCLSLRRVSPTFYISLLFFLQLLLVYSTMTCANSPFISSLYFMRLLISCAAIVFQNNLYHNRVSKFIRIYESIHTLLNFIHLYHHNSIVGTYINIQFDQSLFLKIVLTTRSLVIEFHQAFSYPRYTGEIFDGPARSRKFS